MGSTKDLVVDGEIGRKWHRTPTNTDFGRGVWKTKGAFSIRDLKHLIPQAEIPNKAECMTMTNALFVEELRKRHPEINVCYDGLLDKDGNRVDVQTLLDRGDTTRFTLMRLAHTPESFSKGDLQIYREAMRSGELQCAVADVESIFRAGFPLGSSTFKRIFGAMGMAKEYETLATYQQVVLGLNEIQRLVDERGLSFYPGLEKVLADSGLGKRIPKPGFVMKNPVFDSTTKFETAGDRVITKDEERKLSGLDEEGYSSWTENDVRKIERVQFDLAGRRNVLVYDGKVESVAFRRKPWLADFGFTVDENRTAVLYTDAKGVVWALPTNKEYQRAVATAAGIDIAIGRAKELAVQCGNEDGWRNYMAPVLNDMNIDLHAIFESTLDVMGHVIGHVGNMLLEETVFDVPPIATWVDRMLPYASKVEYQEA